MKMLEDRIRKDGIVREGNVLKVDSFINHQMDIPLFREMAKEWKRLFAGKPINKVLTIEASGIGIAAIVASEFNNWRRPSSLLVLHASFNIKKKENNPPQARFEE